MRIIVDASLSPGQQTAQAVHGIVQFFVEHPEEALRWQQHNNSIIVVKAPQQKIQNTYKEAVSQGIKTSVFHEPDLDNLLTALTLAPSEWSVKATRKFRLAG